MQLFSFVDMWLWSYCFYKKCLFSTDTLHMRRCSDTNCILVLQKVMLWLIAPCANREFSYSLFNI